jgi:hypothetical protein
VGPVSALKPHGRRPHPSTSSTPAAVPPTVRPGAADGCAFGETSAVELELHAYQVVARRDGYFAFDMNRLARAGCSRVRYALLGVQAPTCEGAALGDDHALSATLGHGEVRADRVSLVLGHEDRVLAETPHAAEEQLGLAPDQQGPPRDVGVEALDATVIEGPHVVLAASMMKRR